MEQWFCSKCGKVLYSKSVPECCGERMIGYNFEEAEQKLISNSNGFIPVKKKYLEEWKHHSIAKEVSDKLHNDQCNSLSSHIIAFVDRLIEKLEELDSDA